MSHGAQPLRVMIVTPLGRNGAGGIDRVIDQLRETGAERDDLRLNFAVSRGARIWQSLYNLPWTALRILAGGVMRHLDVVHLNLASNASAYRKLLLSWVCRLARVPYVIHLHGGMFDEFWSTLPERRREVMDRFFANASAIIVLGDVWRDVVIAHVPDVAGRIFVIPNATRDRPKASGSGATPNILFLGQVSRAKGVPDLVQALAALPRDLKWSATIAGNGEVEATMRQVSALGLGDRVALPGWVGSGDVERLIDKADILVLPSYVENLPMSVIEGMAAGLAIVATPVGATPDVIADGETGLMVKPGDVDGLTAALARLATDASLRRRLGQAAQAFRREHLDVRDYVDRLMVPWTSTRSLGADRVQSRAVRRA